MFKRFIQWIKSVLDPDRVLEFYELWPEIVHLSKIDQIRAVASNHGWEELVLREENKMISFAKEDQRINVYYTTMTVGTCIKHPRQGRTQLFRKNVKLIQLNDIFDNPRCHTGSGYHKRKTHRRK